MRESTAYRWEQKSAINYVHLNIPVWWAMPTKFFMAKFAVNWYNIKADY